MHWFLTCLPALGLVAGLSGCSDDGVPADTDSNGSGAATAPTTSDGDTNTTATATADPTAASDTNAGSTGGANPTTGIATSGESDTAPGTGSGTDAATDSGSSGGSDGSTGSTGGSSGSTGSTSTGDEELGLGDDCTDDDECASGVCWDFADYDKTCTGAVCTLTCKSNTECVDAFEDAGAPSPEGTTCGGDGRCDPVGTGFGAFACAGAGGV